MTHYPSAIDRTCADGDAELYDECGSQMQLFRAGLEEANKTGKTLIVSYGAEWCIWCHVFDAHVNGVTGKYEYRAYEKRLSMVERSGDEVLLDARKLNEYAAKNLIIAHVEADKAPDGLDVLRAAGVDPATVRGYPYIFSVTGSGKLAAVFDQDTSETRRDDPRDLYRGYDRTSLLSQLMQMRHAAASR
ncbi:MAG: hypothetical protein ABL973_19190 [Micropepsaceae bacterium]